MSEFHIDIYDPTIDIYNAIFAHIILWWPLIASLFILSAELLRFGCQCKGKYLVKYKKYYCFTSSGHKFDTGMMVPNSATVEPIETKCECGADKNKWYIKMLKTFVLISLVIPFYGYCVSEEFYIFHIGMLLWCTICFLITMLCK